MKAQSPQLDWKKVRELFDMAVTLATAERRPWLDDACGDDVALRDAVEKLLRANDNAGEFIEQPALVPEVLLETRTPALDLTGQMLGPYRVLYELGSGGMGSVWLARRADGQYQKTVAIKVVSITADPQIIHRFERERQILADLDHPNIVRLLDGGTYEFAIGESTKKLPYVVMDYVEGKSLRAWLKGRGALPVAEAVTIARQICQGLHAAHRQGIIHRDIKPENIIVAESEQGTHVKILDFGIAKLRQADSSVTQTNLGAVVGTTAYMSPEQAAGAAPDKIDERSDVYSLGMVLYEMLTGQVAFTGETFLEVINKHQFERPVPPSRRNPDLPAAFDHVVMKALEKAPEKRQQTMQALAEDLERALQEPAAPVLAPERKSPRTVLWLASAVLLSGLLFFAAKTWWQGQVLKAPPNTSTALPTPLPPNIELRTTLQYAPFRTRKGVTQTVSSFDRVQEDDTFHFELQMPFDGTVYLLYEWRDGRLTWTNPDQDDLPQRGRAGEKLRIPEKGGIRLDARTGSQNFLAIYVPVTSQWTLDNAMIPNHPTFATGLISRKPPITNRYATISKTDADKILASLEKSAYAITVPGEQNAAGIRLEITVPATRGFPILYHRIVLHQSSRQ